MANSQALQLLRQSEAERQAQIDKENAARRAAQEAEVAKAREYADRLRASIPDYSPLPVNPSVASQNWVPPGIAAQQNFSGPSNWTPPSGIATVIPNQNMQGYWVPPSNANAASSGITGLAAK